MKKGKRKTSETFAIIALDDSVRAYAKKMKKDSATVNSELIALKLKWDTVCEAERVYALAKKEYRKALKRAVRNRGE